MLLHPLSAITATSSTVSDRNMNFVDIRNHTAIAGGIAFAVK